MQSLCHRFLVCFTIIIWSFGVTAAQHDAPPQNHNIKAAENAAICAAFAKIMGLQTSLYPKPRNNGIAASIMPPIRCATLPFKMDVKILISKIST